MLSSLLLVAIALALASCTSSSSDTAKPAKVDPTTENWGDRIGTYTFDQAMTELGTPAFVGESSAGKTAEWVLRRSPQMSFGFGAGGGSYGSGGAVGVGEGEILSNVRLRASDVQKPIVL